MVTEGDFSKGMLKKAAEKSLSALNISLAQANVAALPFKPDTLQTVTCAHAFS